MRIMWCQRDPLARKNSIANLYVKNLVPSVTSARLEEIFCKYGTILSCKVADDNGKSKGFGFVQFDSEYSAMTALNTLNGTMLEGKKLYMCNFVKKNEREGTSEETFTNLYVKNLDKNISEELLKEKFSEHGTVCNIAIMKDDEENSKGFGFVKFNSHEDAKKAVECLNGVLLGSKNLFVGRAQKKAEREEILKHVYDNTSYNKSEKSNASNLYVKNLNVAIDDRKLEELFSAYGKVTSAKVMHHDNGVSKGIGFVRFSSPEEAKKALDSLNGTTVQGMSLYVALAHSREERHRKYQNCQALYPYQSFHTSNWDILFPNYQPLYYGVPTCAAPISMPYCSLYQPNNHENSGRCVSGLFPRGVQNPEEKLSAYHTKSATYISTQDQNFGALKQQKPSSKFGNKSINSAVGSTSSKGVQKKKNGKMLHPYYDNIQAGHAENRTSILLKMDKSRMQDLLNSRNSFGKQVWKAIQFLKEAHSGATSDGKIPRVCQ